MDSIVCFFSWYDVFVFFSVFFFHSNSFSSSSFCVSFYSFLCFCPRCNSVLLALTCFHSLHCAYFYLARKFNCRLWANLITTEINKKVKQQQQRKTNPSNTFASWQIALKTRIYLCNGASLKLTFDEHIPTIKWQRFTIKINIFRRSVFFSSLFFGLCFGFFIISTLASECSWNGLQLNTVCSLVNHHFNAIKWY